MRLFYFSFLVFSSVAFLGGCDDGLPTACGAPALGEESIKCSEPPPPPVCGNGIVEWDEECDDANDVGGDGCEPDCTIIPVCGNAVLEPGEDCDDGNDINADGCEADCSFLPLDFEATCTASTPLLDEEGRVVLDDDDEPVIQSTDRVALGSDEACRLYLTCRGTGPAAFPVDVRPLPVVLASESETKVRLEQTLSVTGAVRASLPAPDEVSIEGGTLTYAIDLDPGPVSFSAEVDWLGLGRLTLPLPGGDPWPVPLQRAEVGFPHDGTSAIAVTLIGLELEVDLLADPLACSPVGQAEIVFTSPN